MNRRSRFIVSLQAALHECGKAGRGSHRRGPAGFFCEWRSVHAQEAPYLPIIKDMIALEKDFEEPMKAAKAMSSQTKTKGSRAKAKAKASA